MTRRRSLSPLKRIAAHKREAQHWRQLAIERVSVYGDTDMRCAQGYDEIAMQHERSMWIWRGVVVLAGTGIMLVVAQFTT